MPLTDPATRARAKADGWTDAEIDSFIAQQGQQEVNVVDAGAGMVGDPSYEYADEDAPEDMAPPEGYEWEQEYQNIVNNAQTQPSATEAQVPPDDPDTFMGGFGEQTNPGWQGLKRMVQGGPIGMAEDVLKSHGQLIEKAFEEWGAGNKSTAARNLIEAMIPVIGPQMSALGDAAQNKQWKRLAGGAAGFAANVAGPQIGGAAVRGVKGRMGKMATGMQRKALNPQGTFASTEAQVRASLEEGITPSAEGIQRQKAAQTRRGQNIREAATDLPQTRRKGVVGRVVTELDRMKERTGFADEQAAIEKVKQQFLDRFRSQEGGAVRDLSGPLEQWETTSEYGTRARDMGAYRKSRSKPKVRAKRDATAKVAEVLRQDLAEQFPELRQPMGEYGGIADLGPTIDEAAKNAARHSTGFSINPVDLAAKIMQDPAVRSKIAIKLHKASGQGIKQSMGRVKEYSSLMSAAQGRLDKDFARGKYLAGPKVVPGASVEAPLSEGAPDPRLAEQSLREEAGGPGDGPGGGVGSVRFRSDEPPYRGEGPPTVVNIGASAAEAFNKGNALKGRLERKREAAMGRKGGQRPPNRTGQEPPSRGTVVPTGGEDMTTPKGGIRDKVRRVRAEGGRMELDENGNPITSNKMYDEPVGPQEPSRFTVDITPRTKDGGQGEGITVAGKTAAEALETARNSYSGTGAVNITLNEGGLPLIDSPGPDLGAAIDGVYALGDIAKRKGGPGIPRPRKPRGKKMYDEPIGPNPRDVHEDAVQAGRRYADDMHADGMLDEAMADTDELMVGISEYADHLGGEDAEWGRVAEKAFRDRAAELKGPKPNKLKARLSKKRGGFTKEEAAQAKEEGEGLSYREAKRRAEEMGREAARSSKNLRMDPFQKIDPADWMDNFTDESDTPLDLLHGRLATEAFVREIKRMQAEYGKGVAEGPGLRRPVPKNLIPLEEENFITLDDEGPPGPKGPARK